MKLAPHINRKKKSGPSQLAHGLCSLLRFFTFFDTEDRKACGTFFTHLLRVRRHLATASRNYNVAWFREMRNRQAEELESMTL